jgi:hypothetical protein
VGGAVLARLIGEQRGVDAAEHDIRAAVTGTAPQLVPAQRVAGVNADPDDIARRDRVEVEGLQRLVDDRGHTVVVGRRRGQYVQPSWRDDRGTEGEIARVYEVHSHGHILVVSNEP